VPGLRGSGAGILFVWPVATDLCLQYLSARLCGVARTHQVSREGCSMTKQRGPTGRFAKAAPADTADPSVTFGRNRAAAEQTIAALQSVGRLEVIDSARVATFRTLADAVDADPVNASLWREYRAAEHTLREVTDDVDDELTQILGRLSTPLGDETDAGAPNPRAKGRRSS
jgi:hypothetical protein